MSIYIVYCITYVLVELVHSKTAHGELCNVRKIIKCGIKLCKVNKVSYSGASASVTL